MTSETASPPPSRRIGWPALIAALLAVIAVSVAATLWVARTWLYPQPFQPVALDARERASLDAKLEELSRAAPGGSAPMPGRTPDARADTVQPAPYSERAEDRVLHFTQRELNALIARNPDLAQRLALHLSDDLLSATMLVTLPPDLPLFASQTVRVSTGLRLRHDGTRLTAVIEGVSIMGVPLPGAWLGGLKGRDLAALYRDEGGFWQAFGEGVRELRIENGRLRVELAP